LEPLEVRRRKDALNVLLPSRGIPAGQYACISKTQKLVIVHSIKIRDSEREEGDHLEVLEDGRIPLADLFVREVPTGSETMKTQHPHLRLGLLLIHQLNCFPFHLCVEKRTTTTKESCY